MTKAAVLGAPINHSLSPTIHESAYRFLGWDWTYERHLVESGGLARFLTSHQGEFRGLSLTMPLKEEALALLDSLTEMAKRTNSANTIVFDELGSHGFNTDVQGFRDALSFHKVAIPSEVVILGGGATARSAVAAVDGLAKVIKVYVRSERRGKALVNAALSSIVNIRNWQELTDGEFGVGNQLIISTTPQGATDHLVPNSTEGVFFESLYHPWPTPLLNRWRSAGGKVIDGLDLLLWQAIGQLEVMSPAGALCKRDGSRVNKEELSLHMRSDAVKILDSRSMSK